MAEKNKSETISQRPKLDTEDIKRRLAMMDQRLDNIDSIVSAVVERVMSQPIAINITCPYCGKNIEVSMIGSQKPGKR